MAEVRPDEGSGDDFALQDALKPPAAMGDARDGGTGSKAEPRKAGAAALGFGLLIVVLAALLVAGAAGFWP